jgi:hypothetical protein
MRYYLLILLFLTQQTLFAQLDSTKKIEPVKRHYVSIYANTLVKELIGFTSSNFSSPYILQYAYQPKLDKGLRYHAVIGYDYAYEKNIENRVSKGDTISSRLGLSKVLKLSKRLQLNVGVEGLVQNQNILTNTAFGSVFSSSGDSIFTRVRTKSFSYGGGLQLSFMYEVSKNLFLGSEVLYHYRLTKSRQSTTIVRKEYINDVEISADTEVLSNKDQLRGFIYTPPVALILSFRF